MLAASTSLLLAVTPLIPAVERHCLPCHGGDKVEARFDLRDEPSHARWQEAFSQVDREEMPPRDPSPTAEEREEILAWINDRLSPSGTAPRDPAPARVRLTREEYNRTVRALLGIDLRPGDRLEPDPQGETGFANDAVSLQVTPSQAAKYLEAAERTVEGWLALAEPRLRLEARFEAEALDRSSPHLKEFDQGVLFATEPQVISAGIDVPVDGWYEIRFHGSTMGKPTRLQILDGTEPLASVEVTHPRPTSITHRIPVLLRQGWHTLSFHQVNLVPQASLPRDADQVMNHRAARNRMQVPDLPATASPEQIETRATLEEKCFYLQQTFEWLFAYGTEGDPRDIVRFRDYATERITGVREARELHRESLPEESRAAFDQAWQERNGALEKAHSDHLGRIAGIKWMDWTRHQGQLYLDWIGVAGPIIPEGARPLRSDDLTVETFARLAWRTDPDAQELARYQSVWQDLGGDDAARARIFAAVLASPRFLFRDNRDPATRLAYFLHGGPPDARTVSTDWNDAPQARRAIRRLIAEPGFEESLEDFTGQWLGTAPLGHAHLPDEYRFPGYKRHLALSARQEPVRFFLRLVRENRSVLELLDSDWTMVNADLAAFYGWHLPPGRSEWRVAALPDKRRGGLIGMSAVLATTSSPVRTTPVARGKWVWETLLGRNPGTPLPDAGVLPAMAGEEGLTLREELRRHREDPRCIRCHEKLDPIGLSLENFDAVGAWRDQVAGQSVDASADFFRGEPFTGPEGLRGQLRTHQEEFVAELVRRLLAYAHGRSCDDEWEAIQGIASRVREDRWSAATLFEEVAMHLLAHGPSGELSPGSAPGAP